MVPGGRAGGVGLQDDDVIGCHFMVDRSGMGRGAGWGRRDGQSRGAAGWRSRWRSSCV